MKETSETLKKALNALASGNYADGVKILREATDRGEADATYALGELYREGIGVDRSIIQALKYYKKAIDLGYTPAMIGMSLLYATGKGVASDNNKAIELLEKAASQGDASAYRILGLIYESGNYGITPDLKLAREYLLKASDAQDESATFHLCRFYLEGIGVEKNREIAFHLCEKSADAGDIDGLYALAYFYETGFEGHKQDLTLANKLYRKAARLGHKTAKDILKRFPPIVELGTIALSPGVGRTLQQPDIIELIDRHKSGNWGDVSPLEWDKNDVALKARQIVRSIHLSQYYEVVVTTDEGRRSTYIEFLEEDFDNQPIDYLESAERVVRLFKLMHSAYSFMQKM